MKTMAVVESQDPGIWLEPYTISAWTTPDWQNNVHNSYSLNHGHGSWGSLYYNVLVSGTYRFNVQVSSEGNYDFGRIYHNGAQFWAVSGYWGPGNVDRTLNAGDTLWFRYNKDGSVSRGSDMMWVHSITLL